MKAKFDLNHVRDCIKNSNPGDHMFTLGKALSPVVSHLQMTQVEAKEFILDQITKLEEKNFSERVRIGRDVYDVYGKTIQNIPWYIKFSIFEDEKGKFIYSISFHPPDKTLITNSETLNSY